MHWKEVVHHEESLKDHVDKYKEDKKPHHGFISFLKEKVDHLTHQHDLDDQEKEDLHQLGVDHYNEVKEEPEQQTFLPEEEKTEQEEEQEEKEMEVTAPAPAPAVEPTPTPVTTENELPEVYLNHLDEDREVIEPIPLHEVSEMLLDYLEKNGHLNELEHIYDESKAMARTKGFLNRLFVFKKLYSRKRDGEVDYYSKSLAYPPADVVNDLFFALEHQ